MKRLKGFTLVELLVVTMIIALLCGLLIPVLATIVDEMRKSTCRNNLKQLVSYTIQYGHEYDDRVPLEDRNIPRNFIKPDYFRGDIFNLVNWPKEVFMCPKRPVCAQVAGAQHGSEYDTRTWATPIKNYETSYFYLGNGYGTATNSIEPTSGKKVRAVKITEGNKMIWADRVAYQASLKIWQINHQYAVGNIVTIIGSNQAYLDGHVGWVGAGVYPAQLEVEPDPQGNAQAVHDPTNSTYYHRYWW